MNLVLPETRANRTENLPTVNEVAVLIPDSQGQSILLLTIGRDIILQRRGGTLQRISETHPSYDALQYPLLFPNGEDGWSINLHEHSKITIQQWVCYYMQIRMFNKETSLIHRGGRLFQQYLVDSFAKMEQDRLNFIKYNQAAIRADCYQGLVDSIGSYTANVGTRIVLPSTFVNGPRYVAQLYQDSMEMVRKFGKADLFITMTCNPKWPAITAELLEGQVASDRPDIVSRVFNDTLKELLKDLLKKDILGKVKAYCHVIEFQKRGLPHAHILLILEGNDI